MFGKSKYAIMARFAFMNAISLFFCGVLYLLMLARLGKYIEEWYSSSFSTALYIFGGILGAAIALTWIVLFCTQMDDLYNERG